MPNFFRWLGLGRRKKDADLKMTPGDYPLTLVSVHNANEGSWLLCEISDGRYKGAKLALGLESAVFILTEEQTAKLKAEQGQQ